MPTLDYLSRPERGLWWMLECHADFPLLSDTTWGRRQMDAVADAAYAHSGLGAVGLTVHERDRCLINQDMGVRIERLMEGVRWIQQHLSVYPIWNCAIRLPDEATRQYFGGSTHLVDLGIYGEPMAKDYRRVRDLGRLQKMVDAASLWGVSYLSWDELVAAHPERYARYARVRQRLNCQDAFLHLRDKVVWVDPSTPDDGKIPMWRLYRSFGPRWYLNPLAHLSLAAAKASQAIWPLVTRTR